MRAFFGIAGLGETDPPFEVRVTVEATPAGSRLTQQETLEVPAEALDALDAGPARARTFGDVLRLLALFPSARPLSSELRALQRLGVQGQLARELSVWLEAIRAHLEGAVVPAAGAAR